MASSKNLAHNSTHVVRLILDSMLSICQYNMDFNSAIRFITLSWYFGVHGYVNILPWKLVNKLVCVMKVFLSIGLFVRRSYCCRCYCVGLIVVGVIA